MKFLFIFFCLAILSPDYLFAAGNEGIKSFSAAKKYATKIHAEHPFTIYCGCKYSGKTIDLRSCGYQVYKDARRAARLEWEHVVPAEAFGQSFAEWREGGVSTGCVKKGKSFKGRKCAETNPEFARMEADLYNLWPEIGELNGLRSNYSMAALGGVKAVSGGAGRSLASGTAGITFGQCEAVIAQKKFEPMDMAKGAVARTYLYMDQAYPGRGIISEKNRPLFEAWNKQFPVSEWECKRARKIAKVQGNENPVMRSACN